MLAISARHMGQDALNNATKIRHQEGHKHCYPYLAQG